MGNCLAQWTAEPHGLPGILLMGILVVDIAIVFTATASSGLRKDRKSRDWDDRERL